MSDVILVHPKIGPKIYTSRKYLPLRLLKIAVLVHQKYDVKIIDQMIDKNWRNHLLKELNKNPICVGITSMAGKQIFHGLKASKIVKENSEVPVVWGGIHTSLLPRQTLENPNIDILVKGEGEVTFYELVRALDEKKGLKGIRGIWHKDNGKIKNNPDRPFLDLNSLPRTPYHLVDLKKYDEILVETSRGCPFRCAFCYNRSYNKGVYRELSVKNSIKEIKLAKTYKERIYIHVTDDNFFVNLKRTKKIISAIKEEGVENMRWYLKIRADAILRMKKEWLDLLESSNSLIDIGVESGSQRILDLIKKGMRVSDVITVNKKLKDTNLIVVYNFMIGLPTETREDLKATIKLAFRLVEENPRCIPVPFACYTPYPGTELYDVAIKHGFQPPKKLEDWASYNWNTVNLPWLSDIEKRHLEVISFNSKFITRLGLKNITEWEFYNGMKFKSWALLGYFYRPIGRYRLKNFCKQFK